jgi:hypothetical protein
VAILDGFDTLAIGAEVRFVEELGERGPQESTGQLVRKHHIADWNRMSARADNMSIMHSIHTTGIGT